jgi:2-hydroxychromene-2-carboxylate isomerase
VTANVVPKARRVASCLPWFLLMIETLPERSDTYARRVRFPPIRLGEFAIHYGLHTPQATYPRAAASALLENVTRLYERICPPQ